MSIHYDGLAPSPEDLTNSQNVLHGDNSNEQWDDTSDFHWYQPFLPSSECSGSQQAMEVVGGIAGFPVTPQDQHQSQTGTCANPEIIYGNTMLPQEVLPLTMTGNDHEPLSPSPLIGSSESKNQLPVIIMVPQRLYPGEDTLIGENEWENSIIDFITSDSRLFMASKVLKFKCPELKSRDNPIKFDSGSISLRLEWPGYIAWTCQIKTKNTFHGQSIPITEAKLMRHVAKALQRFIKDVQGQPVDDAHSRWQVGPVGSNRVSIDKMAIISLRRVRWASWQPEFGLVA